MRERLFIAISIPDNIKHLFTNVLTNVTKDVYCPMTKVKENAMHITIAFLGDTDTNRIPELNSALNEIGLRHNKFSLTMDSLSCFPNERTPRTLLAKIGGEVDALTELYRDVVLTLDDLRLEYDRKQFKPHMTLARIRDGATPIQLQALMKNYSSYTLDKVEPFEVAEFKLFKSELTSMGPIYTAKNITKLS